MPASLTVISNNDVVQPNSVNPWHLLCHVTVPAYTNNAGEALDAQEIFLIHNNEDIEWNGHTWVASSFDFQTLDVKPGELPTFNLMISNVDGAVAALVDQYDGGNGAIVNFYVVSSVDIANATAAQQYTFELQGASADDNYVTFTLGGVSPMRYPFPGIMFYWSHCPYVYNSPTVQANLDPRGADCGYVGSAAQCDHSLNGANGCKAHGNQERFGGFDDINNQGFRYATSV